MASPGLRSALEFFGKDDAEGVDKFKAVAFRALHEQRLDEELRAARADAERLQRENGALARELRALQDAFDANVGDRERVLAFKAKRIEELNLKLRDAEAINASLLQTLSGVTSGDHGGAGSRAAMAALLSAGKPLFHALDACKELEFRRLHDEKRAQCEQLAQQLAADAALVREMRAFAGEKQRLEALVEQLQARAAAAAAQNDEHVHFLERKLVFEHDRLRREKDADVQACEAEMARRMTAQLDATTQRTIEENARVQLELRFQSAQLEKLVRQLEQLAAEKKREQQEKRVFEDMTASLSKRLRFYEQLFAKMQEKEQLRSRQLASSHAKPADAPPELPELPSNQPPASRPSRWRDEEEYDDDGSGGGDQLNAAADALETHLQQRAFARKQVDAMLRFRLTRRERQQEQLRQPKATAVSTPLVKKRVVLSKAVYAPSSYPRGRKTVENPTTLDAFIRQHAAIARPPPDASKFPQVDAFAAADASSTASTVLPGLAPRPPPPFDRSDMWRARRSASPPESPATARF